MFKVESAGGKTLCLPNHPKLKVPLLCVRMSDKYPYVIGEVKRVIPQFRVNCRNVAEFELVDDVLRLKYECDSNNPVMREYYECASDMALCRDKGGWYIGLADDCNVARKMDGLRLIEIGKVACR